MRAIAFAIVLTRTMHNVRHQELAGGDALLRGIVLVVRGKVDKKETLYAGIETPRAQAITESNFE